MERKFETSVVKDISEIEKHLQIILDVMAKVGAEEVSITAKGNIIDFKFKGSLGTEVSGKVTVEGVTVTISCETIPADGPFSEMLSDMIVKAFEEDVLR